MAYNILDDMEYIELPLTNSDKTVMVDGDYDGEYFSQFKWYVGSSGYVTRGKIAGYDYERRTRNKASGERVYLHNEVLPVKPGYIVRHLDGNLLNCRSVNLVYVLNGAGRFKDRKYVPIPHRGSKNGGYRGVVKSGYGYGTLFRKKFYGASATMVQAARKYDELAYAAYGDKAILNFPHKESS